MVQLINPVTGDEAIQIVAALSAGVAAEKVAATFHTTATAVKKLHTAARRQGLTAWCQAQCARDARCFTPQIGSTPKPRVNCGRAPEFIITAVTEVMLQHLSVTEAAQLFGLKPFELELAAVTAHNQGIMVWAQHLRAHCVPETVLNHVTKRYYDNSGARRIKMVAACLSGCLGDDQQVARLFHTSPVYLHRLLRQAHAQGLLLWCERMRIHDLGRHSSCRECADPEVSCAAAAALREAAVLAVLQQERDLATVAAILGVSTAEVASWLQAAPNTSC